jgi:hypothetical protein
MPTSDELRLQLEALRKLSSHPLRISEHAVLDRLLYKNRSQHRHGLYFHRLDHVRRLLRASWGHRAWESVDVMLSSQSASAPGPLVFSTIDLQDLEELHENLSNASVRVIPVAALSVVNQLVLRGHFTHFSVAVIATLARLFVIEQRICAEIASAASHMRVLLAYDKQDTDCLVKEDLGEPVPDASDKAFERQLHSPYPEIRHLQVDAPELVATTGPDAHPQSLYDLIAPDNPEAGKIVAAIANARSSSSRAPLSLPFGRPAAKISGSLTLTSAFVPKTVIVDTDELDVSRLSFSSPNPTTGVREIAQNERNTGERNTGGRNTGEHNDVVHGTRVSLSETDAKRRRYDVDKSRPSPIHLSRIMIDNVPSPSNDDDEADIDDIFSAID